MGVVFPSMSLETASVAWAARKTPFWSLDSLCEGWSCTDCAGLEIWDWLALSTWLDCGVG
jgi:hypothetical protein